MGVLLSATLGIIGAIMFLNLRNDDYRMAGFLFGVFCVTLIGGGITMSHVKYLDFLDRLDTVIEQINEDKSDEDSNQS
jgi:hypothetical protein